eukprot:1148183-Pelagomonas_calceolata.AAC.3
MEAWKFDDAMRGKPAPQLWCGCACMYEQAWSAAEPIVTPGTGPKPHLCVEGLAPPILQRRLQRFLHWSCQPV